MTATKTKQNKNAAIKKILLTLNQILNKQDKNKQKMMDLLEKDRITPLVDATVPRYCHDLPYHCNSNREKESEKKGMHTYS